MQIAKDDSQLGYKEGFWDRLLNNKIFLDKMFIDWW